MSSEKYYEYKVKKEKVKDSIIIKDSKDVKTLLGSKVKGCTTELFYVISLDNSGYVLALREYDSGHSWESYIDKSELARDVVITGASSFIFVHTHPSGERLEPSSADNKLTSDLFKMGEIINVPLLDHIILSSTLAIYSYLDNNNIFPQEQLTIPKCLVCQSKMKIISKRFCAYNYDEQLRAKCTHCKKEYDINKIMIGMYANKDISEMLHGLVLANLSQELQVSTVFMEEYFKKIKNLNINT